ncbi:MAG: hypothetical protein ACPL7K_01855, partial [Armatimonadota bacterium]
MVDLKRCAGSIASLCHSRPRYNIRVDSDHAEPRPRASLTKAIRRGFQAVYDNLGYVVFASFSAFVATSALFTGAVAVLRTARPGMGGVILFVPAALGAWLVAAGVFYYANRSVYHEHPAAADTWAGIKMLAWPALKLFVLDVAVMIVLLGDMVFFLA